MPERPHQNETERRFVRSEDPSLSPEANRLLTEELREVVGREEVEVPVGTPHRAEQPHANRSSLMATIISNRALVIVTFFAALVVGAIISLATGSYLAVLVAVGVHALGMMLVAAGAVQLTTQVEHVAPETAARLEAEGVADPDRVLSQLVEDFAGAQHAGGVNEVVSGGANERTVHGDDDPAQAMLEQRTAMTPQATPGPAGGEASAVEALPWWVVTGVMVISVVAVPFFSQGWVVPLVIVPLGLGWMAMQRWMARRDQAAGDRPTGDTRGAQRRLAPFTAFVVIAIIWFMVVMQSVTGFV